MTALAVVVEIVWRGLCDAATYMPSQIGSSWFKEAWVEGGVIQPYGVPVDQIMWSNVAMIWTVGG